MADRKAGGVDATNQAFIRYDQVEKKQEYHLAEASHHEAFDEEYRIRTCDVGRFLRGNEADKRALRHRAGRGAPATSASRSSKATASMRRSTTRPKPGSLELFTAGDTRGEAALSRPAPRLGESRLLPDQGDERHPSRPGRRLGLLPARVRSRRACAFHAADFWPRPELEPFFRRLCQSHETLVLPVMQSLLTYLGCDPHLYDRKLTAHELRPAAQLLPAGRARGRSGGRRAAPGPRGRRPVHVPPGPARRGAPGAEPREHEVGAARGARRARSS